MDFLKLAMVHYGAVFVGLLIGALAHIGRLLADGVVPTVLQVLGYIMQLGLIGLIAVNIVKVSGFVDRDTHALVSAFLAISAQEVIQAVKRHGWRGMLKSVLAGFGLKVTDNK